MKFPSTQCAIHNSGALSRRRLAGLLATCMVAVVCFAQSPAAQAQGFLPNPVRVLSTVPANGDVNPYGVTFVPSGFPGGVLQPGDILVSNFNNNQNLQGTGTTIVRVPQSGAASLFFQSSMQQSGLSTALKVLSSGFVLVGSFPTVDGTCATVQPGSILILNDNGQQLGSVSGPEINGPWDMTVYENGSKVQAFVANALAGTITRLDFHVSQGQISLKDQVGIASGYQHQCDPAALVDAPTGTVYDAASDTLFVASTLDNAVFAVPDAGHATGSQGTGSIVYQDATHLHGALAMAEAPNGHLLVTNNDVTNGDPNQPSEIVEFTKQGQYVKEVSVDPNLGGSFGLQVHKFGNNVTQLAAVDDNQVNLIIWTLPAH